MATLDARIVELEKRAAASDRDSSWLVILVPIGEGDQPLHSLKCSRTEKVWTITPQETQAEFTARVHAEATHTGKSALVVTVKNDTGQPVET